MSYETRFRFDEDLMNITAEKIRVEKKEFDPMENIKDVAVVKNTGLDIGTMNIVSAKLDGDDNVNTNSFRNVFLKVDADSLGTRDLDSISHTVIEDDVYILSEDAYTFANIFNQQVSRPMSKGMISSSEIDAIEILSVMVAALISKAPTDDSICCYSIPANPIDANMNVTFHENVFGRIISQLGWKPLALYEGMSLIYSECADTDFSGIGISFGAGMTNISIAFKGVQVRSFSLARGGDWIDENAALHVAGLPTNKATLVKEKEDFDIGNFMVGGNKKERRIREALSYYYTDLISYTVHQIVGEFDKVEADFPTELPIIISGGTSRASGFLENMKQQFAKEEMPFEISEVRHASNPLTAVAEGCLVRSFKS